MTLHRFFVEPEILTAGFNQPLEIGGEIAHQLTRVLRMSAGDQILLLDNQGSEYLAELDALERSGKQEKVRLRLLEKNVAKNEPRTKLVLYQGLLKGEKFDYLLQKGTEAGITAFVPVITERCVSDSASAGKLERWRKIVREAAEQSRRGILPQVESPIDLKIALARMSSDDLSLVAWEDEHTLSLRTLLQNYENNPPNSLSWLIGPEGGLSEVEIETARAANIKAVSLGPRIFRAETAGPIAAALTLYTFGDYDIAS